MTAVTTMAATTTTTVNVASIKNEIINITLHIIHSYMTSMISYRNIFIFQQGKDEILNKIIEKKMLRFSEKTALTQRNQQK